MFLLVLLERMDERICGFGGGLLYPRLTKILADFYLGDIMQLS